ncbi:hypothetical protein MEPL4_2c00180 [Melissococcus plutonius]|nr:hypothetical protein MEPL_c000710 [Melissococcus plutonius S1]KMT25731.1 hypothetical protein MEPL2_1c00720 [Melissococcus plutonius]KMT27076.1 hypothetical protein MEPL3_1c00990 [Melissococcus plutonius]KMT28177.1 hypothetical protein MEPL1_2c00020 [Melissococcus plutonius]KMT29914.1 hypothetical protein MEPL4_2c00180 [Melissococcus plutonius]
MMKKIPPIITPVAIVSIGLVLGTTTTIVNSSPTYGLKKENISTPSTSSVINSKDEEKGKDQTETTESINNSATSTTSSIDETMDENTSNTSNLESKDQTESTSSTDNRNREEQSAENKGNDEPSVNDRNQEEPTTAPYPATDNTDKQPTQRANTTIQSGQN